MLASLCYDVEDLITTESDAAVRWVADFLREAGLTANFFLVGEKVRLLRERGREDALEALKAHELGFHSTWHSVHPTIAERCQDLSFLDGIRTLMEIEKDGWEETESILGRRLIGWGTTGGSWTPSLCGLMHQFGGVYAYSPAVFGDHSVVWYGNCLNFGKLIAGLDTIYQSDTAYREGLMRFANQVEEALSSNRPWLGIFAGHPTRMISKDFWDGVNFRNGANPPREEWKPQPLCSAEELETIRRNFQDFAGKLAGEPRLQIRPLSQVARQFDAQRPGCSGEHLLWIAHRVAESAHPLFTESFSAAEIVVLFAHAILLGETTGAWFIRPTVFGPDATPPETGKARIPRSAMPDIAQEITGSRSETGCLPASVRVGELTVSIGQAMVGFARRLLHPEAESVEVPTVPPYPELGNAVADAALQGLRGWMIHPPDLRTDKILEAARLQAWTLKPAWHREALPWHL